MIEDVREYLREAERLEHEATELRIMASTVTRRNGLCAERQGLTGPSGCCGNPDDCTGRNRR